jgi:soluble lytic murein transglycosylase-like protein
MKFLIVILFTLNAHTDDNIVKIIEIKAHKYNIDAKLAVAIAKTESSLNPNAVGSLGELGLFQLRPEFHNVIDGNTKHNVEVAMKYLSYVKRKCASKYGNAWFICFNTGPYRQNIIANPTNFSYYKKVMNHYNGVHID